MYRNNVKEIGYECRKGCRVIFGLFEAAQIRGKEKQLHGICGTLAVQAIDFVGRAVEVSILPVNFFSLPKHVLCALYTAPKTTSG